MSRPLLHLVLSIFLWLMFWPLQSQAEPENGTVVIEDPADGESAVVIEDSSDAKSEDAILIEPETKGTDQGDEILIESSDHNQTEAHEGEPDAIASPPGELERNEDDARLKLEQVWFEYGALTRSSNSVDGQGYGHATATLEWRPSGPWEVQLSGRLDGYLQHGEPDFFTLIGDYGDSFLRWRGEGIRLTAGAQTILWGRIDELPPMDRLSRVDWSRGVLDDLPDRRRAQTVLRMEWFLGGGKLDAAWIPAFRPAALPSHENIWYPIDQVRGEILGLELDPAFQMLVRNARIDDDGPSGDGGFGLRYTKTGANLDIGLTVQNNRQSLPYFRYEATTASLVAEYPKSWVLGGDFALQTEAVTWRTELVYLDTVPITRSNGVYDTTEGLSWGAAAEFFPGDGDLRVNLQVVGTHLLNASHVINRTDIYNLNGSVETPFAHGRWRAKARFFIGLDERDIYVNPEIAFLGWEPHEFYLDFHYFEGTEGTLGGFYENNSLVALGWRARF